METLATKVEHLGKSFIYSSDTGPEWDISNLGQNIDVAMLEAGTLRPQPGVHLTPAEAALMARSAGAERLILTHLRPDHDKEEIRRQGETAFGAPVELAHQGAVFEL